MPVPLETNTPAVSQLAPLIIAVPLIGGALLSPFTKICPRWISDAACSLCAAASVVLSTLLLLHTLSSGPVTYWLGGWLPQKGIALGISLHVDPAGAGLAAFISFLVFCASVYTWRRFDLVGTLFQALLLVFMASMCGFALTGDIFNMFVWFEMMTAAAIALTAHKIQESHAIEGAINLAITNSIAGFIVLLGIALLYGRTGALNMAQIGHTLASHPVDALVMMSFGLLVCGFFVKGALVPFHFWLDDAHAVASTPICMLFSGIMVQLGLYGVARIYWSVFAGTLGPYTHVIQPLFIGVGIATALTGAIMAFAQRHMKRLLAFSTVSHSGMFVAAIGIFNATALAAVALFIVAHGLIKAALFASAGNYLNRFRSLDEEVLGGKGRATPLNSALYLAGGLALAGLPPFAIAAAKSWYDSSLSEHALLAVAVAMAVAGAIDAGAVLRNGIHIAFGIGRAQHTGWSPREEESEVEGERVERPVWTMLAPAMLLLAAAIWAGSSGQVWNAAAVAGRMFVSGGHAFLHVKSLSVHVKTLDFSFEDAGISVAVTVAALIAAFGGLFREHIPEQLAPVLGPPLRFIRLLHSGNYMDYVAYAMFGVAAYSLWLIFGA